ncbi:MAG: hypothetical protein IT430_02100 [Phycisphaerales bacterium]|nr:hypothetical protein [Phycisphaerales bacterium]
MFSMRSVISIVLSISIVAGASAQDYPYALLRLPSQNESLKSDAAGALNAFGDVVGSAPTESIWWPRAVLWPREGGVIDLGTLGGDLSSAGDINDLGEIVGSSGFELGGSIFVGHAFLWRNGQMIDLGTLGGESSGAVGINNRSQVVGNSEFEFGNLASVGFLWEQGIMRELDDPWPDRNATDVWGIGEDGGVVGKGLNLDGMQRAMLWIDEVPVDLGSLSQGSSVAYAINDLGQIVGSSNAANGNLHAVVWIDGQIFDLHVPEYGPASWGQDINNAGQVIGAIGYLGTREMFIRESSQPMRLLKDLTPPRTREDWRFDRGHINDAGQISVTAYIRGTIDRFALLLTPVNPSMDLAAPSPGTAGTANTITVSNVTPGARVTFLYSRNGGGTRIPGCDLQQNALQLDQPTIIGSAIADANGVATITRPVPLIARGQTILFQAVVQNECAISQLVVHEFE